MLGVDARVVPCQSPSNHVLCCGHTQELSERFARPVRNLVDEYSTQLGIALSPDSQAGGRWSLTAGGSLFALGVTGAIKGYRADLVLVDDPFPNREDALNENNRRKVYDWMIGDVMPRLRPGAKPPESTRPSYSRRLPANMMKLAAHRVTGFGTRTRTIHMGSFFATSSKFSHRRYGRVYFCKTPSSRAGIFSRMNG
jgi:hypothetical protein